MSISSFSFWKNKSSLDPNSAYFDYTVIAVQIGVTATDVVPINLSLATSAPTWWNDVNADGSNIRVFDSAWNEMARDVVWIDRVNKQGIVNINLSVSEITDTVVRVAVDKSLVNGYANSDLYGRYNVYGSKYEVFWELQSDPNGTVYVSPEDRTQNRVDATDVGSLVPSDVIIRNGFRRTSINNNSNKYIVFPSYTRSNVYTVSSIFQLYVMNSAERDVILSKGRAFFGSASGEFHLAGYGGLSHKIAGSTSVRKQASYANFKAEQPANTDLHTAGTWDGTSSTDSLKIYLDALLKGVATPTFTSLWNNSAFNWTFGRSRIGETGYEHPLNGEAINIRIANIVRPIAELSLESSMYKKHSVVCSYGAEAFKILP